MPAENKAAGTKRTPPKRNPPWYRSGPVIVGTTAATVAILAVLMTIVLSSDKRIVHDTTPLTPIPTTIETATPTPTSTTAPGTAPTSTAPTPPVSTTYEQQPSESTSLPAPSSTTYRIWIPSIPPLPEIPPLPPIPTIPPIPGLP